MSPSVVEMTKELVLAQIQAGTLVPEDMQDVLRRTHQNLMTLKSREESGSLVSAPVDWRKSITQHAVICLECGAQFKQLNGRHLRLHGLDARSYRTKYGIPATQPLAAKATTALRRRIAAETRPWETAPTYVKAQQEKAATAKKAGRKSGARKR
jgi:predicted transcriptional regulator